MIKYKTSPIHTAFRGGHICPVLVTKSELKEAFVVRSYLGAHCRPLWREMLKCDNFNDAHKIQQLWKPATKNGLKKKSELKSGNCQPLWKGMSENYNFENAHENLQI